MENKGVFQVLLKGEKYVITYFERGLSRDLSEYDDKYGFDNYDLAVDFVNNNSLELDKAVSSIKDDELIQLKKLREEKAIREEIQNNSEKNKPFKREKKQKVKKEKVKKEKTSNNGFKRFVAGFLTGVTILVGGHFAGKGVSKVIDEVKKDAIVSEEENNVIEVKDANTLTGKFREFLVKKGIIKCDLLNDEKIAITVLKNEVTAEEIKTLSDEFFTDELFTSLVGELDIDVSELDEASKIEFCKNYLVDLGIDVAALDIATDIENIKTVDETLSTEKFEELVAKFAKPYVENNLNLSTEDLTKFNAILLIDRLAEENPELLSELTSVQREEEFLNDAAKTIGVTYMYNHKAWEADKNTENFIWISEGIPENDPQRAKMEEIEDYVRRIAVAAKEDNADLVNAIAEEFIADLTNPDGSLNALDDGIEFGSQVYIALINNSIGRNYLTTENRDYFNVRSTSETNVSNIFAVIRGCNSESKTKSLEK